MKTNLLEYALLTLFASLVSLCGYAQGTFVYDQQSSTEGFPGESGIPIQPNQPVGQSFSPSFNAVGFVRLRLTDLNSGNGLGATVYVNLRSASITGTILATAAPVFMPNGFGVGSNAFTDFFFSLAVPVTPGGTYVFQPVVQSGDFWSVGSHNGFDYSGGTAIIGGAADQFNNDLWFREGIVVPEPGTWALLVFGCGLLAWQRRKFR